MVTAIAPDEMRDELHRLGVIPGATLVVHMSYRAVRPVLGGPRGVIEAVLGAVGGVDANPRRRSNGSDVDFPPPRSTQ